MDIWTIALIVSAFLCSLVAGLLFAFAIVAMPGIKNLNDGEFIRAFQEMDAIIQNNQPIFMLAWMGSVVVLILAGILSIGRLEGVEAGVMLVAVLIYLIGVQVLTVVVNIPLNNQLQTVEVDKLDEASLKEAREAFEPRWNRFNQIRTVVAGITVILLMILVALI